MASMCLLTSPFQDSYPSPTQEFDGGGTFFEHSSLTARPHTPGMAVGHSGQVLHSGLAVTRGERYILVGFVGWQEGSPYSSVSTRHAVEDAWCKWGEGAWDRGATPALVAVS